jgi:hypothetical protein
MNKINRLKHPHNAIEVDAYNYSRDFELRLQPVLQSFFSVLDYVSSKIQIEHKLRILTKIEHSNLLRSQFVFRFADKFGLQKSEAINLASIFLLEGAKDSLNLVSDPKKSKSLLLKFGFTVQLLEHSQIFSPWHTEQNLLEFLDLTTNKQNTKERLLHYLSQLSIFTSTPKDPDELPVSLLLSPIEFINFSSVWLSRPELYQTSMCLTSSGKKILSKSENSSNVGYRENLGLLIDLHIRIAQELWHRCLPLDQADSAFLMELA